MKQKMKAALAFCLTLSVCAPLHVQADDTSALTLSAASAVLIDTDSGTRLYDVSSTAELAGAGTGRLMDVLVSLDSDSETVTYTDNGNDYAAKTGLTDGATYETDDLRYAAILGGDEDAADALSQLYDDTLTRMNDKADEIGMTSTVYTNTYGHEDGETTTAYDIALLARQYARNDDLRIYYSASSYTPSSLDNSAEITRDVMSYDGLIGSFETASDAAKTIAVASAERDNTRLTAVVMGVSDKDTARKELTLLLNYGFEHYKSYTIQKEDVEDAALSMDQDNVHYDITFSLGTDINVIMPVDTDTSEITTKVVYENKDDPEKVEAYLAVMKGDSEVGEMQMEKDVVTTRIVNKSAIPVFDIICMAVAAVFVCLFILKYLTLAIKPKE